MSAPDWSRSAPVNVVIGSDGEPITREQAEALAVLTDAAARARYVTRTAAGLDPLPDVVSADTIADTDPTPPHGITRPPEPVDAGNGHTAADPARFVALTAAELVALPWLLDTDHLTENGRAVSNLLDAGYVIGRMS